jgi:DNA-binding transcriptional regulator LsrR (DeoR family)
MDRLPDDSIIATSFGRTIGVGIDAVLSRDAVLAHKASKPALVIPLMGDPLGRHAGSKGISATSHARRLQGRFTMQRGAEGPISLEGIPPVLPLKAFANKDQLLGAKALIERMRSYKRIFGSNASSKTPPLIERVRLAVTSCGSFKQGWDVYANELIEEGAVSIQELQKYALGDYCGDLVARPSNADSTGLAGLRELWTGARLEHYRQIASGATGGGLGGTLVLLIDDSKSEVLLEICRLRAVSHICCDEVAAQGLRRLLAVVRRTGEWHGVRVVQ